MLESVLARRKLARLVRDWTELRQLWERYLGAEEVPDLEESRFLKLKADISSRLPLLETAVPSGFAQEASKHHRGMTDLLGALITLRSPRAVTEREREQFLSRWHAHFLFLNELKGMALGTRARPAGENRHAARQPLVPTGMPNFKPRRRHSIGDIARTIFGTAILLLIGYLIVVSAGVRFQRSWAGVEQYGTASRQLWDAVPGRVADFLEPIVASYGTEVTIALLGVLLLSVGYWVFIRGR